MVTETMFVVSVFIGGFVCFGIGIIVGIRIIINCDKAVNSAFEKEETE